jgi:hypothetical protein
MSSNPIPPCSYDPDLWLDRDADPDAPDLTDIDHPEPEPGTDIVPPAPEDEPTKQVRKAKRTNR